MPLKDYLEPSQCPAARPSLEAMSPETNTLHSAVDAQIRDSGKPYLHPDGPTVQLDLFGARQMIEWQTQKGTCSMIGESCWSELPTVYGRYATEPGHKLIGIVKKLENAQAAVVTDCGMQATAIVQDILLTPKSHALMSRQVYNKTKAYLNWLSQRIDIKPQIVDELTAEVLEREVKPNTTLVLAETYTNPLVRAFDVKAISDVIVKLRQERAPGLRMVADNTIVTPWGVKEPLLNFPGIDVVISAGTKAMGGEDRDMWGYITSNRIGMMNQATDIQAMRGGILSWRSAQGILESFPRAESHFKKRCGTATKLASFLENHPKVEAVFHPSLESHPDRSIINEHYSMPGSLLSFRIEGLDEDATGHFCDVLATCIPFRYSLSFDGYLTKLNHHKTVSEFYTPDPVVRKDGIDRLVRIGAGLDEADDLIACLNWALWNHESLSQEDVETWQDERRTALGLPLSSQG